MEIFWTGMQIFKMCSTGLEFSRDFQAILSQLKLEES